MGHQSAGLRPLITLSGNMGQSHDWPARSDQV
jgi:hypothetical protein